MNCDEPRNNFRTARQTRAQLGRKWLTIGVCIATFAAIGAPTNEPPTTSGFYYYQDNISDMPWSINIARIERNRPEFKLCTTLGKSNVFGMEVVSEQVKMLPRDLGQPLAAVNGDFWDKTEGYLGRPRNIQIRQGELVSGPSGHAAFWIDCNGNPQISNIVSQFVITWPDGKTNTFGLNEFRKEDQIIIYTTAVGNSTKTVGGTELILERDGDSPWLPLHASQRYSARVREVRTTGNSPTSPDTVVVAIGPKVAGLSQLTPGCIIRFTTDTSPGLIGVEVAIGGGPTLVEDGKAMQWHGLVHIRHPRTAVAFNSKYIYLLEVDGRQRDLSVGMTFPEFANYLVKLGCDRALNLDGGGSSTLWALGNVMNSPSEGRERPSANILAVLRKAPKPK